MADTLLHFFTVSPSRTSHAASINTFVALRGSINRIFTSGVRLFFDGNQINPLTNFSLDLLRALPTSISLDAISAVLRINAAPIPADTTHGDALLLTLMNRSESLAQTKLATDLKTCGGLDTSTTSGGNFLEPKQMFYDNGPIDNVFTLTGKPDISSAIGYVYVEIKATGVDPAVGLVGLDFEVLDQAINRVYTIRNTAAHARLVVAFAATGRSAWIIIYNRDLADGMGEAVHLYRIQHNVIFTLFRALQQPWTHFWTQDGPLLVAALGCLGIYHKTVIVH